MIRVELNEVAELYLLISHPTGVTYSHQCAGYGCYHNELEGYLVPLSHTDAISKQLYKYFYEDSKWKGHCYSGIDEETAVAVEEILAANYSTSWIVVDRTKFSKSVEAWIYVTAKDDSPIIPFCYGSDKSTEIVLIWENSD